MLGEITDHDIVIADLEAGAGTTLRLQPGQVDIVLVVAEPTEKSIETARRVASIAEQRARVLVIANRLLDGEDRRRISAVLGSYDIVEVPDDPAIAASDRDGLAPIDAHPDAPGVAAIRRVADLLVSG